MKGYKSRQYYHVLDLYDYLHCTNDARKKST